MFDNSIDPDVLAILGSTTTQSKSIQKVNEVAKQANEIAVQTSSLDSQGNLIHVGDKVTVGADKAIGRVVKLGKYATVKVPNDGEYELPCSVLTLCDKQNDKQDLLLSEPVQTDSLSDVMSGKTFIPKPIRHAATSDKFSSYAFESLHASVTEDAKLNEVDDFETAERLRELNQGEDFDMGI